MLLTALFFPKCRLFSGYEALNFFVTYFIKYPVKRGIYKICINRSAEIADIIPVRHIDALYPINKFKYKINSIAFQGYLYSNFTILLIMTDSKNI